MKRVDTCVFMLEYEYVYEYAQAEGKSELHHRLCASGGGADCMQEGIQSGGRGATEYSNDDSVIFCVSGSLNFFSLFLFFFFLPLAELV